MEAATFKIKTPCLTGGRSHTPLARTELTSIGLNYYVPGRKNTLHTHPGEDHAFVVLEGEATFHDKAGKATLLKKGEGIMLPEGWHYWFQNTGHIPLALLRFSALKGNPKVKRIDALGRKREDYEQDYVAVDGEPIEGQYWEFS